MTIPNIDYVNLFAKLADGRMIRLSLNEHKRIRKFVLLDTAEAKRFAGLSLMNKDIDLLLEAIDEMKNLTHSPIIQQSLMFFAVITYGKLFTSNESGRPKLDFNDIFRHASESLKEEHVRITHMRNGYIAHAGSDFDQGHVVGTVVGGIGFDLHCQMSHVMTITPTLDAFTSLCLYVQAEVKKKTEKALQKVQAYLSNLNENEIENLLDQIQIMSLYSMEAPNKNDLDKSNRSISCNELVKSANDNPEIF